MIKYDEVSPSNNVEEIFRLSKDIAKSKEHSKVSEADLFEAFVRLGGGTIGKMLSKKGIELGIAVSALFLESGDLDISKFDEKAKAALDAAQRFAARTGWQGVSTPHLFMGLCTVDNSLTSTLIREQGLDPQTITSIIERRFIQGRGYVEPEIRLGLSNTSVRLRQILISASEIAEKEKSSLTAERHLLLAFLREGGGETGEIVSKLGLDLTAFMPHNARIPDGHPCK